MEKVELEKETQEPKEEVIAQSKEEAKEQAEENIVKDFPNIDADDIKSDEKKSEEDEQANIEDAKDAIHEKEPKEKSLEKALEKKKEGNELFKAEKYHDALECYTEALDLIPEEEKDKAAIHFNTGMAYGKIVRH